MTVTLPLLPFLIFGPVLVLIYVCTLPWLARHTDFLSRAHTHLRQIAPLYLVVGPSAITYFALCGTVSALFGMAWLWRLAGQSREQIIQSGIFTMFHAVEWACSVVGSYGFAWLLRWLRMRRFWFAILFLSLSVSAAYRTARLDPGPAFVSGPGIVFSPDLLDTVPVAIGLVLFAFHWSRLTGSLHRTQAEDSC